MHALKLICLTIIQLGKQVCLFPQTVADAVKQKRRQTVLAKEGAAERLDRLRNPSKYVGK
jgi:hypothetical protein